MHTTKVFQFEAIETRDGAEPITYVVNAERTEVSSTHSRGKMISPLVHWQFYIRMTGDRIIPLKRLDATTLVDSDTQNRRFLAKVTNPLLE